jgi:hypothetical protein
LLANTGIRSELAARSCGIERGIGWASPKQIREARRHLRPARPQAFWLRSVGSSELDAVQEVRRLEQCFDRGRERHCKRRFRSRGCVQADERIRFTADERPAVRARRELGHDRSRARFLAIGGQVRRAGVERADRPRGGRALGDGLRDRAELFGE